MFDYLEDLGIIIVITSIMIDVVFLGIAILVYTRPILILSSQIIGYSMIAGLCGFVIAFVGKLKVDGYV